MLFKDRVLETSTTTGTGNFTLSGAVTGYQTFNSAFGTASLPAFYYCIIAVDAAGTPTGDWEVGQGHLSASTTLVRDSVLASSTGSAINFSAGTKNVFADVPADFVSKCVNNFYHSTASVGNGNDTTEDTLQTYTLPGGSLGSNGQAVRITAFGRLAANTHNRSFRLYFGATLVGGTTSITNAAVVIWRLEAIVVRTGASTQQCYEFAYAGATNAAPTFQFNLFTSPTETLANDIVIKVTGQTLTAAANDIICDYMSVEMLGG